MDHQPNNPLHGVTLAKILDHLVEKYGWEELGAKININCFNTNPSVKSSLGFLRKTPWAREKVERLYLRSIGKRQPPKDVSPRAHMAPLGDVDRREDDDVAPQDDVARPEVENPIEDSSPKESPWEAAKRVRDSRG